MAVASIETTLELWASALREVKARMRPLFTQQRMAVSAGLFLESLLGHEPRKTGWMRAGAAVGLQPTGLSRGDPGPWRQQAIRGRWQADARRAMVRDYVGEHLADEDAVLVVDETGFLKQGKASCGPSTSSGSAAIHRFGRQDHQLPGRGVCRLCRAPRSCLYRPGAVSAEILDRRSGPQGGGACAGRSRVCHQAGPGVAHDRAGLGRRCAS